MIVIYFYKISVGHIGVHSQQQAVLTEYLLTTISMPANCSDPFQCNYMYMKNILSNVSICLHGGFWPMNATKI
jgi:hypothetical protein